MAWAFGLCDLNGVSIGRLHWATERKLTIPLNGLDTAQVKLKLDDPLAEEITSREGDVLLKVYQDSTLRFIGDLTTAEEYGGGGTWYRRIIDRNGLMNVGYVLPQGFEGGVTAIGEIALSYDQTSIDARGTFEEVIPSDIENFQLRQALAEAHVAVRKVPRQIITFGPAGGDNEGVTLVCNFAGPLWRLLKRLLGVPYPAVVPTWSQVAAEVIVRQMLDQLNANSDTGVREGTFDTLYAGDYGPAYMKPMAEALAEMQEAKVAFPVGIPPVYDAQDEFTQPGAFPNWMDGETATDGSTWDTSHPGTAATDFDIYDAGDYAHRSAAGDTSYSTGRFAISGTGDHTAVVVGIDYQLANSFATGYHIYGGVVARFTDPDNWLMALFDLQNNIFFLRKKVAGSDPSWETFTFDPGGIAASTRYSIRLLVDELGNYAGWHYATGFTGTPGAPIFQGRDSVLATGGALATGKVGFYDAMTTGVAADRNYYSFFAADYTGPQSFDFRVNPIEPTADLLGHPGTLPTIATLDLRYQIGTSKPAAIFEYGRTHPTYGTDYTVGDYVPGRAKVNEQERFNEEFRVNGIDLTIDDEGRETLVPELIPQ